MKKPVFALAAATVAVFTATAASANPLTAAPLVQVSPTNSPFAGADADGPPCNGVDPSLQTGRNFPGTEVEPWAAANPAVPGNLTAAWQQDRWSNGRGHALPGAES